ncbi:hypothetical protein O6H91_Y517600 [Diphasiastrum complanatum]|nr:hypothetical protein O6H91_Y517600 [Diphasiastrum complanatum]
MTWTFDIDTNQEIGFAFFNIICACANIAEIEKKKTLCTLIISINHERVDCFTKIDLSVAKLDVITTVRPISSNTISQIEFEILTCLKEIPTVDTAFFDELDKTFF